MRTGFITAAIAIVLVYALTGCATTVHYSAKGQVISKERKPDYVFWKGAGKIATDAIIHGAIEIYAEK